MPSLCPGMPSVCTAIPSLCPSMSSLCIAMRNGSNGKRVTALRHLALQDDWESYTKMTEMMSGTQIVGDDLLVTNVERIATGIPVLVPLHTHTHVD